MGRAGEEERGGRRDGRGGEEPASSDSVLYRVLGHVSGDEEAATSMRGERSLPAPAPATHGDLLVRQEPGPARTSSPAKGDGPPECIRVTGAGCRLVKLSRGAGV